MWLRKPVYEAMPFVYMVVGIVSMGAALWVDARAWAYMLLFVGLVMLISGIVLWLKRRDYRLSRSRATFDDLR